LLAAHSAMIKSAAEVYVVDRSKERLTLAADTGATPVNFEDGNPVEQILELRGKNKTLQGALREDERKKMPGVMCAIDAVGYQAHSESDPEKEDPMQVMNWIADIINPTGAVGCVGVYFQEEPGGVDANAKKGRFLMPLGKLWSKGVTLGMGQTPVKKYATYLRDMIIAGRAKPSFIVSHRLPLAAAPEAYAAFDARGVGKSETYTKVLLKPDLDRAA
jgi:glutathione-independent formaldehyde dehydrogenase